MKDGDNPTPQEQAQETVASHAGQATIDSENSSGSVYQSPTATLEYDGGLTTHHYLSSSVSESDSAEHFSDAIQESDDTASVYSAEEIPQKAGGNIQILVSKSSLHQWSASASKISILQNDSSGSQSTPSRIPLPTHSVDSRIAGTQSAKSFQFEETLGTIEGSRIPSPFRLRDALHSQNLKGSKSEPKIPSRPPSPDRERDHQESLAVRNVTEAYLPEDFTAEDIPSSESENITAISVQPHDEDGGLEKFRSDDLFGDTGYIPFDSPDPVVHTAPEVSRILPTAPPLSASDDREKEQSETQDDADFVTTVLIVPDSELGDELLPGRSPSYTIISYSSQAFDVSDGEEPEAEQEEATASRPPRSSPVPIVPLKTEKVEIVELERARQVESLLVAPVEYFQIDVSDLIAMGQANAREAVMVAAESVDSKMNDESLSQEIVEATSSLRTLPSFDEPNDDDYVEIDEPADSSTSKKVTRFGKLKSKLQRRTSSKDMNLKKTGSSAKTTLKVRRKPPKAPSSRPASAKRPITPPMTTTAAPSVLKPKMNTPGVSRFSSIRASIKHDVEKMKKGVTLDAGLLNKPRRSSSDIAILTNDLEPTKNELKEAKTSDHSIRDIFQDQAALQSSKENSKDMPSPSPKKTSREEDGVTPVLSPSNQTKLNSLTSRYRVQMRKYKGQVTDLTELQNKVGTLHESLSQLKTQIISLAGGMPMSLSDLPAPTVVAAAASSEHNEEPTPVDSQIEEITADNENLRTEIGRLHSNMNVVCRENKQIKEDLSSVKEQLSTSRKQVTDLLKANEERLQNIENMKIETQKAKRVADTYRRKLDEFQKSSSEQKVKNEEEKSRRIENEKTLIAEVNALKNKLHLEVTKRECAQHSLTNLSEEKENLESQISELQHTAADLHQKLLEQKQEIDKATSVQEEYNLLQANVNKLEAELVDSQKYCSALASRIDSSEKAEEETSKRLIQLSEELLVKMNLIQQLSEQQRFEQNKRMDLPVADVDFSREKRRMRKFDSLKSGKKKPRTADGDEYKIISKLSSLVGFEIDYQELATASDKEKCENTQLILKICSDFDKVLRNKDAEIEKQKQQNTDLQNLHQEKQALIEQLYEFVNETNASICRRSSSPYAADNKEEEKNLEKSSDLNITEEGGTKEHPDFQELYMMMEVKRHSLMRMESQIRSLQEVHAHCGMRRTMQESRIAELETVLANCLD